MAVDLTALRAALETRPAVVRVVIADAAGSTPRDVGASMLVWEDGQSGTIGGGELEFRAAMSARAQLRTGNSPTIERLPLGPALGQCCGGAVTLLSEVMTLDDVRALENNVLHARPIDGSSGMPLAIKRQMKSARNQGTQPQAALVQGWMVEPIARPTDQVWIYGAGHVGRSLVATLSPLPNLQITWVDVAADRFPDDISANVTALPTANPATAVQLAPDNAHHLILTYSHVMDLEITHAILLRDFASAGLIGSATKWARFRKRLAALGHNSTKIDRITCPIGDPSLGKHPQAIALGVSTALLKSVAQNKKTNTTHHDRGMSFDRGFAPD
ncbi:xanthine dehydrogenase accessory protein XdhC [Aliiroseovarius marinus]|uniref:xanthine dehydrogenase accessory protein XdhC n=1 Tax=Aliiroseovarius marinus TaxID=2500159 RepID=UPI003D7E9206